MALWSVEGFKVQMDDMTVKYGVGVNTAYFFPFVVAGMPAIDDTLSGVVYGELLEKEGTAIGGSGGGEHSYTF